MIPTEEEYNKAKEIVSAYENEQKRLLDLRIEAFKEDLKEYFETNLLDGYHKVEDFELNPCWTGNPNRFDIYPEPFMDESYCGDNDEAIKQLADKHGVNVSFYGGMYGK